MPTYVSLLSTKLLLVSCSNMRYYPPRIGADGGECMQSGCSSSVCLPGPSSHGAPMAVVMLAVTCELVRMTRVDGCVDGAN